MPSIADVVVVGAGPAGCIAAERLRARGLRVVHLEAGPRLPKGKPAPEVDRRAWAYRAEGGSFDWYRVRAVGGRALLWGGWSYRFDDHVLRRAGFPYGGESLAAAYVEIEQRLGVVEGIIDERYAHAAGALDLRILPKRAPLLADGRVWTPVGTETARRVRSNNVALRIGHAKGRARTLACLNLRDGMTRMVRARAFVLAASPIETARILLESRVGGAGSRIGRGLVDHLVASYLLIEPRSSPSSDGRGPFPGCALVESFVNLDARSERAYRGGFSIEMTGPVPLGTFGVERMVPADEVARHSATQIHALGESFAHDARYVTLDAERRDALGRSIPVIHVASSAEDVALAADMKQACVELADAIAVSGSRLVPFLDPLQAGAGHEAGTCAMGTNDDSACDADGRLRALTNVWIADASAFPTSGDRHPTLTVLAHSLRVADSVAANTRA